MEFRNNISSFNSIIFLSKINYIISYITLEILRTEKSRALFTILLEW